MISLHLQGSTRVFILVVKRKNNYVTFNQTDNKLGQYMLFSVSHKIWEANSILSDLLFFDLSCWRTPISSTRLIHILPPANLGSSVSPYHEVMRMERRLRSSSEGAGGPRVHGNHRDAVGMEGGGLLKHRNNSSSSKMGSLVGVLNANAFRNWLSEVYIKAGSVGTLVNTKGTQDIWSCFDTQRNELSGAVKILISDIGHISSKNVYIVLYWNSS